MSKSVTIQELWNLARRVRNPQESLTSEERDMLADWLETSAREAEDIQSVTQSRVNYFAERSIKQR